MNLTHRKFFEGLQKERDGSLQPVARQKLEQHLSVCPDCRGMAALDSLLIHTGSSSIGRVSEKLQDNRHLASAILQRKRLRNAFWEPVRGLSWAAVALLLVIFLGWTIEGLRPMDVSIAGSQPELGAAAPKLPWGAGPVSPSRLAGPDFDITDILRNLNNKLGVYFFPLSLLPILLIGFIGAFLGILKKPKSWLVFLLVMLGILFAGVYWVQRPVTSGEVSGGYLVLFILPLFVAVSAFLFVHLLTQDTLRTRRVLAGLAIFAAALLLFLIGPWWDPSVNQGANRFIFLILILFGLVPALAWRAWEWKGRWRWLAYSIFGFSLISLLLTVLPRTLLPPVESWFNTISILGAYMIWGPVSVVLAARLITALLWSPKPLAWSRWVPEALAVIFLALSLYAEIRVLRIRDSVTEDQIAAAFFLILACITGVMVCVASVWKRTGPKLWASLALILIFCAVQFPALSLPQNFAEQVTLDRAAQVNTAIQQYHTQNGSYPTSLTQLMPRYLLWVPEPVTYYKSVWCYDGNQEYYRLGYYEADYYKYSLRGISVKLYGSAGEPPEQSTPCDLDLQAAIDKEQSR